MKNKPYNVRIPYSHKNLERDMNLHQELTDELAKTVELLKLIRDIAAKFKAIEPKRYNILRELETMNNELEDVAERYQDI